MNRFLLSVLALVLSLLSLNALAQDLTVYTSRSKMLIDPIVLSFTQQTGLQVNVQYGTTAELFKQLQQEGDLSPADVFWAQDGVVLKLLEPQLITLPADIVQQQYTQLPNNDKTWVEISARARSLAYSPKRVKLASLPKSIFDLAEDEWENKVGWAPSNAGFQAFVTALRATKGEDVALKWLNDLLANGAKSYKNNRALLEAIADNEIDVALVNNYYLPLYKSKYFQYPVEQTFLADGDLANLVMVTAAGILKSSKNSQNAEEFIRYLLKPSSQQYLLTEGNEYPVIKDVIINPNLSSVSNIEKVGAIVSLDKLVDIQETKKILLDLGLIE